MTVAGNDNLQGHVYGWLQDIGCTIDQSTATDGGFEIIARWSDGQPFYVVRRKEKPDTLAILSKTTLERVSLVLMARDRPIPRGEPVSQRASDAL